MIIKISIFLLVTLFSSCAVVKDFSDASSQLAPVAIRTYNVQYAHGMTKKIFEGKYKDFFEILRMRKKSRVDDLFYYLHVSNFFARYDHDFKDRIYSFTAGQVCTSRFNTDIEVRYTVKARVLEETVKISFSDIRHIPYEFIAEARGYEYATTPSSEQHVREISVPCIRKIEKKLVETIVNHKVAVTPEY